jgi:hypothetical protein
MREDDILIGSLIELFNLRFAPAQDDSASDDRHGIHGGISEMKHLQDEFKIFQKGRPFYKSAQLLGLGGLHNNKLKNRWLGILKDLSDYESDQPKVNGDVRIVTALIDNLALAAPLPCLLTSHDSRPKGERIVKVFDSSQPLHYIDQTYLTISIPMKPKGSPPTDGGGPAPKPTPAAKPKPPAKPKAPPKPKPKK